MSSQIIFPTENTFWIINNGSIYIDGYTSAGTTTTFGNGTQIYWIGSNHDEYIAQCRAIGLTPRNTNPNGVAMKALTTNRLRQIDETVYQLSKTVDSLNTVIKGERISATQARLWLIQNGIELSTIETAINSIEDISIRESVRAQWEYAPYIERKNPWLSELASALGLTNSDLNRAFIEAINL